jgi:drug/metabolite transporter (DMT)-like permease
MTASMLEDRQESTPSTWPLIAAFTAVYVIWGSTYLAIRYAIETMPPFAMASVRFLIAGGLLVAWARLRGAPWPRRAEIKGASLVWLLLLTGGNGLVVWGQQWVPSGLASVLVGTVAFWIVVIDWRFFSGRRPSPRVWLGVFAGLAGIAILAGGRGIVDGGAPALLGALTIVLAALSWAIGSLVARTAAMPAAPRMANGVQMLAGSVGLAVMGVATGDWGQIDIAQVSLVSWLAMLYLIIFGAIVAYGAYLYLVRVATPARVATYAYVNPVVALLLGWAVAGEPIGPRTLVGAAIVLASVMLISLSRKPRA